MLKLAYRGTPDIRVVVFNQVPVMAWFRLPTPESEGRANVTQGALGLGVDMPPHYYLATQHKNGLITYPPGTKKKLGD
jgi:hypothetical protein